MPANLNQLLAQQVEVEVVQLEKPQQVEVVEVEVVEVAALRHRLEVEVAAEVEVVEANHPGDPRKTLHGRR